MKKLMCFFALVLLVASCSSDGGSGPTNESDVLLKKLVETDEYGTTTVTTFIYNGKKIAKMNYPDGHRTFTYSGNLITEIKFYGIDDTLLQTCTYTYDSGERLTSFKRVQWLSDFGSIENYVYDSDGTISMIGYWGDTTSQTDLHQTGAVHFSGGEVSMTEVEYEFGSESHTYTYDNKNNPLGNVIGLDKISFIDSEAVGMHHNILTDNHDDQGSIVVTSSTITYNAMNFPVTETKIRNEIAETTSTKQYTYN